MAALSANTAKIAGGTFIARPSPKTFIVKNASTVYQGSLCGMDHANGHIVPLDTSSDRSYVGVALSKLAGDGTATVSVNTLDVYATGVSVTGLTAQSKCPQPVYATTDNDLTLTRQGTNSYCVGLAVAYTSSGVGDVLFFSHSLAAMGGLCGGIGKRRLVVSSFEFVNLADNNKFSFTLWGHGLIKEIGVMPWKAATTASKASTITGDLGGTAITTGALALTTVGLGTSGTAQKVNPTAANEFYDGTVFNGVVSATTAFAEGAGDLYLDIEYLP